MTRRAAVAMCAAACAWIASIGLVALDRPATAVAPVGDSQSTSSGVAFFVRNLSNPRERREARGDLLDSPILPGSVTKAVTLVTAMESGVITADTTAICRRVVTVDGVQFSCAHPDLKRPMTAAEALAHSCNDFFVSLAARLSRQQVNATRVAAGLPPLAPSAKLGPALVGLDGPRVSPRGLIDVLARLMAAGSDSAVPMRAETRRVLAEGLRGAAEYGTASAFAAQKQPAWAKTGTAPMPGGGVLGLVVALAPPDRPTHGVVVVAPGGAGVDAAEIAAGVLAAALTPAGSAAPSAAPPAPSARSARSAPFTMRLGRTMPDGRTRVETLGMDDYVAQVLAGEGQPNAGDAAQQALAITARTFVMANRQRHRREGFDLCDTTHCQVVRPSTDTTRRAAAATSGQVLLHRGQPAFVFYSAWCGGRLERASQVWPGAVDYGTRAIVDDACTGEPPWESEVRAGDLERALRAAGPRGSRLRELRVLQRNASGRVIRLRAEGFTPPDITGHDLRMAVGRVAGWQLVKSTAFDVSRTGSGYRFSGRGYGHGVGLCVVGAGARAGRGESAGDILRFYFPELSLGSIGGGPSLTGSADPPASPPAPEPPVRTPPTAAVSGILVALPAAEERDRAQLIDLARAARDEIAKATSVTSAPSLRITVHPTVESFGRQTGQPWWVSGATEGTSIDLLPLAILKQRGQLERTIRHEVAHVLLDGALAKRPMWVREGAALYFSARHAADEPRPARVPCPSDAELLRSASAGAQRDAYARAEACFARQIADGKAWNEVR